MLQLGAIRTGFVLGISLLLAAIIYFFAANWGGLDRVERIFASAGLVALFYGASYALSKFRSMLGHHTFLSALLLVGGCISFGAAVALLGQIYNSHADSYSLFLVWAIPALLFAGITRYHPFYLLSYVLIHLTLWFYFFPSSMPVNHSEAALLTIGGLFAIINLILFILTERYMGTSSPLKFISFIVLHTSLLLMTNSFVYENAGPWMNLIGVSAIIAGFYYFTRVRLSKTYLAVNALAASAFAIFKFIELAVRHASTAFFFYGLVFVALLLAGNVFFFRYLNKMGQDDDGHPLDAEHEQSAKKKPRRRSDGNVAAVVSIIVTALGVTIGSACLIGLVLFTMDSRDPQMIFLFLSLLFAVPMILLTAINPTVRYTLLYIGYLLGIVSIVWINSIVVAALFALLFAAGWIRLEGRLQRFISYGLVNLALAMVLHSFDFRLELTILLLAIMNAAAYLFHSRIRDGITQQQIKESSLSFTLLFLFWLTFFGDMFPYSYAIFNAFYLIAVSLLLFQSIRRNLALETAISSVFWFAFLVYKYYDLLWSLLHKSITLALLGLLTLFITYAIARRSHISDDNDSAANHNYWQRGFLLLIVIMLQFGFLTYQAVTSERLLRTGDSIKLELAPIDPRSLLQGDYVTLNYSISTLPQSVASGLESRGSRQKLKVVLAPDAKGVHVFKRLYQEGETLASDEIVLNGTTSGWGPVYYGIETYFVPEGTGLEVERSARFAYIRVSANGNALLERLTKE
ncbi:GDYXXLXY domain-containing protein [Paenibacillus oenotherae]|uniref:GDYXXLXY domain-containing protein n=2 Tax=Paenibacillus oenotherae TaxID=1435645 RepID=A0ABS7DDG5_9BACL|nr:GDYXXLXY domain-containing protein [Paenibacillus oenotherae]